MHTTIESKAKEYLSKLQAAVDKEKAAAEILEDMEGLVWAESEKPLTLENKQEILAEVRAVVKSGGRRSLRLYKEAGDNTELLNMLDAIESVLKGE